MFAKDFWKIGSPPGAARAWLPGTLAVALMMTPAVAQTKSMSFGFELNCSANTATMTVPINSAIVVRGIELKVSYVVLNAPQLFGQYADNTHAEVLYTASISNNVASEFGPAQMTGLNVHGGAGNGGYLAAGIMKTWITLPTETGQLTDGVVVTNLSMPAGPYQQLTLLMSCDGYPGDMEMQGVLFYELK